MLVIIHIEYINKDGIFLKSLVGFTYNSKKVKVIII